MSTPVPGPTNRDDPVPGFLPPPPASPAAGWMPPPATTALPTPPPMPGGPESNRQPGSSDLGAPVCRVCGAQPATHVEFHHNIGMLVLRQGKSWSGDACRDCGRSIGRKMTNLTLVTGWTGLISFLMNIGGLFKNTTSLHRLGKLPPAPRPPGAPDPGRPVFLRPGIWALAAAVAVLGFIAANQKPDPTWAMGACVQVRGDQAHPVACGGAHDGTVIAVVGENAPCPLRSKGHIVSGSKRYCVG